MLLLGLLAQGMAVFVVKQLVLKDIILIKGSSCLDQHLRLPS